MKIFNGTEPWSEKVNFIDENNVLVGYDLGQCCCEDANWFLSDKVEQSYEGQQMATAGDLTGWVFDTEFFQEVGDAFIFDGGGMVIFRITNGGQEKFLHLFNVHNGYYSHGFQFKAGDTTIKENYI